MRSRVSNRTESGSLVAGNRKTVRARDDALGVAERSASVLLREKSLVEPLAGRLQHGAVRQAHRILNEGLVVMRESILHARAGNAEVASEKRLEFRRQFRQAVRLALNEISSIVLSPLLFLNFGTVEFSAHANRPLSEVCDEHFNGEARKILEEETGKRIMRE
ncbi:MAG: hypothetical protein HZA83_01130, partial [Thaumarchaeota archaeon]|nr:hypothetical protein [Nitrososphaerota archaeon]